ncbi:MAG: tripartite tricarboxylate transporter TctB family protein [Candidatus Thermoplasmatota archaeon]|nr:tripartite tricarboxylate transporter TctB family protein [Candidatus Thermoplasmatota archaeon]
MNKAPRISTELIFDFLIFVLGLVILVVSVKDGLGSFSRPGTGMYPLFVAISILVFGGVVFIKRMLSEESEPLFAEGTIITFFLMIATFALWIVIMPLLGYVIVTFLATYAFSKVMKLEGWMKPLVLSAGTAIFIYLLFDYWLYIDLPRGFLG